MDLFTGKAKRHSRASAQPRLLFRVVDEARLELFRAGDEFALGDLLVGGAVITKLTMTNSSFRADRWPEHSARHRTRCIQLARSRLRGQGGANFVVSKFFKALERIFVFTEDSRFNISRERVR